MGLIRPPGTRGKENGKRRKECGGTRFLCKKPDSPAPLPAKSHGILDIRENQIQEENAMAKKDDTKIVRGAALDLLRSGCSQGDGGAACLIMQTDTGEQIEQREYTDTRGLRRLKEWLLQNECPVLAIERPE